MTRIQRVLGFIFAFTILCIPLTNPIQAASLNDYVGSFVGEAVVSDTKTNSQSVRDIDIVISLLDEGGIKINWVNVDLVDGRRDLPGVKRRHGELAFSKAENANYFVELSAYNPFEESDELTPMEGDPVRWAALDEEGLRVYSFVVLEDGRFELQTYIRSLEGDTLDLHFERIVDGKIRRTITGRAQRAN